MCGIYGALAYAGRDVRDLEAIFPAMDKALEHRGPDDRGLHVSRDGRIALGHRRLSIIDLSPAGRQPLWNEDGTIGLVFNGEIYNYRELRKLLSPEHRFSSSTDSEVIIHGYETHGEAVLDQLDGMFAFALWDGRANRLLLARDRLGKKPLYFADDGHFVVFASEMKALLACPHIPRSVNPSAVADFLTYGYVPATETMVRGIHKLKAGTVLEWRDGQSRQRTYWDLPPRLGDCDDSTAESCRRIRTLVDQAVAKRLVADVPVSALLSGGVDSTIVVSTMARLQGRGVPTFTVGFEDAGAKVNEDLARARQTAKRYDTDHHEFVIDASRLDLPRLLDRLVWHLDEPSANATVLTTLAIGEVVHDAGIKVVLTGDGGDELFGGYPRYLYDRWTARAARVPYPARAVAATALAHVTDVAVVRRARRFLAKTETIAHAGAADRYLAWRRHFDAGEQTRLLSRPLREALNGYEPSSVVAAALDRVNAASMQDRFAYADLKLWVADESNMRVDRGTMANGLEARCPLLDRALVEYAFSVPFARKVRGGSAKALLKQAFADTLPETVMHGPKRGFFSPVRDWMNTALAATLKDVLAPARIERAGLLDPAGVASVLEGRGWNRQPKKLWSLLVLQLWAERFLP